MAMLSLEVNRFLGNALLDPELMKRIFSVDRVMALQGFKLTPEERSTILASQAHSLPELSQELSGTLAKADIADTDARIEWLKESLSLRSSPMDVYAYAQQKVNAITSKMVSETEHEEVYYYRRIAS
jgi:ribosome biogenesis GTPase A